MSRNGNKIIVELNAHVETEHPSKTMVQMDNSTA